ncbi:MAG: arsenic ABC transporter [Thermoplasmatales archaeon]|nr:arsenic ABC transporter [Thermoplasmatales archaeon]
MSDWPWKMFYTALFVFILTYALISVGKTPRLKFGRAFAAALGMALMVILAVVTPAEALASIDWGVILLLLGMMLLVLGLEHCGLFEILSDYLVSRGGNGKRLLAVVMVISAAMSALVLNDATVLLLTPVVIRCCAACRMDPVPHLVGLAFAANIGSVATAVGNPQNAYITTEGGVGFIDFFIHQIPVAVVCLPVAYAILVIAFRGRLDAEVETASAGRAFGRVRKYPLMAMLVVTTGVFAGFALSDVFGYPLYFPAVAGGVAALASIALTSARDVPSAVARVDWSILVFFVGLFVVMEGISVAGVVSRITDVVIGGHGGPGVPLGPFVALSAILSNLVSNVPATMLLAGMFGSDTPWLLLASTTTLAGNATLLGSAANVIVAEKAENLGVRLDFWKFAAVGLAVTLPTLAIAVGFHLIFPY